MITGILAGNSMLFLILDSQTVLNGVRDGIFLVLQSVVPALFPFMLTTSLINDVLVGKPLPLARKVGKWCSIPGGMEFIFVLGILGGYPIGAKMIQDAYCTGQLDKSSAQRMLGFCNNAGPAFIFGILGPMFIQSQVPWIIWGIHVVSALIVGMILPNKANMTCHYHKVANKNITQILFQCIRTMAVVSAWIIIWRGILSILLQYFLWRLPVFLRVLFMGLCELTNGCIELNAIKNEAIRFVIASSILSCGGLCVTMQTMSASEQVGMRYYFLGKTMQTLISLTLSVIVCLFLYPQSRLPARSALIAINIVLITALVLFVRMRENSGRFSSKYVI